MRTKVKCYERSRKFMNVHESHERSRKVMNVHVNDCEYERSWTFIPLLERSDFRVMKDQYCLWVCRMSRIIITIPNFFNINLLMDNFNF